MKVKELINALEKVRNKEIEVIIRVWEEFDGGAVENCIDVEKIFVDEVLENDESFELNFSIVGNKE
jgi:hypothetical protein